jgi:hypothetical protein
VSSGRPDHFGCSTNSGSGTPADAARPPASPCRSPTPRSTSRPPARFRYVSNIVTCADLAPKDSVAPRS